MNNGETDIDCGGPCPSCGNCTDGIMNQDEDGIDCGGRCSLCEAPETEMGIRLKMGSYPLQFLAWLSLATSLLIIAMTVSLKYGEGIFHNLMDYRMKKKVKVRKIPKAKQVDIRKDTLMSLKRLEKASSIHANKEIDSLNKAMRVYIINIFGLNQGFTVDELKEELKSRNADKMLSGILVSFFNKLTNLLYSGKVMTGTEFRSLVLESQELVNLTSPDKNTVVKKRGRKQTIRIARIDIQEVFSLISKSYEELSSGNIFMAGEYYHKALEVYEKIGDEEKSGIYETISRLHNEIELFEKKFS